MKLKINRVIKYIILSDLALWAGWGLVQPVFAMFIVDNISGGSVFVVGMAAGIHWILKSALRIPIGMYLDMLKGERDDYFFLVSGLFIASLVPFCYLVAEYPWHIYALQAVFACGLAMSLSGWHAIFIRHIDKNKEATESGLDATFFALGIGISGIISGWAVTYFGYEPVFIGAGILGLVGVIILMGLRNEIKGVFDGKLYFNLREIFHKEK